MIQQVDHIGIVVTDIETTRSVFETLGLSVALVEHVPDFAVDIAFLPTGNEGPLIELIEPTAAETEIAQDLAASSQDAILHHIALRVADIDTTLETLKQHEIPLQDSEPRPGAGDARVAFLAPTAAGGVLLELVERSSPAV